jgi:hypothetical protein
MNTTTLTLPQSFAGFDTSYRARSVAKTVRRDAKSAVAHRARSAKLADLLDDVTLYGCALGLTCWMATFVYVVL